MTDTSPENMTKIEDLTDEQITRVLAEMMGLEVYDVITFKTSEVVVWGMDKDGNDTRLAPLTDANDTLMVIEAMCAKGWHYQRTRLANGYRRVAFTRGDITAAIYATAFKRAVSTAAVKALLAMKETEQ